MFFFFFKQKTAYEIGLGIPAEPLFRSHAYSIVIGSKHITLKAASGGIQGDVLATDNNTVGMGDAGIKSAIQRSEERRVGKEWRTVLWWCQGSSESGSRSGCDRGDSDVW